MISRRTRAELSDELEAEGNGLVQCLTFSRRPNLVKVYGPIILLYAVALTAKKGH